MTPVKCDHNLKEHKCTCASVHNSSTTEEREPISGVNNTIYTLYVHNMINQRSEFVDFPVTYSTLVQN